MEMIHFQLGKMKSFSLQVFEKPSPNLRENMKANILGVKITIMCHTPTLGEADK